MEHSDLTISRRDLLVVGAASVAAMNAPSDAVAQAAAAPASAGDVPTAKVSFEVNGQAHALELDTRTTLLDALREHLHLTGTKKGCDHGQCGACTVIVDGRRINSCLTLAVMHEGDEVTTIEGLGTPEQPASDAGRLRQARRLPVRLLHAGPDLLGGRRCSTRSRRGIPSHVTRRPDARRRS